eukprot:gene4904-711_t
MAYREYHPDGTPQEHRAAPTVSTKGHVKRRLPGQKAEALLVARDAWRPPLPDGGHPRVQDYRWHPKLYDSEAKRWNLVDWESTTKRNGERVYQRKYRGTGVEQNITFDEEEKMQETCRMLAICAGALAVMVVQELELNAERRCRDGGFCKSLPAAGWVECPTEGMWQAPRYSSPYPGFQEAFKPMRMFKKELNEREWYSRGGILSQSKLQLPKTTTEETTMTLLIVPFPPSMCRFEMFTTLCIVLNAITLAMDYYDPPPPAYDPNRYEVNSGIVEFLRITNFVFVAIFTVEAIIKILGFGPTAYAKDAWN